jgi:uncharacterized protein (DUF4415 family)
MKNNSDKAYQKYKDYDFANAKTVAETPHLFQLQAGNKSRITMRVDRDLLAILKARAERTGGNYQNLMNEALRQFTQGLTLADVLRETVRETLDKCLGRTEGRKARRRAV